jgi:hypothetical protein
MLEEKERKQDNPFHPDTADQEPEAVQGALTAKQLVREKLAAVKVLGAGQVRDWRRYPGDWPTGGIYWAQLTV